jgi:hypothetical protein
MSDLKRFLLPLQGWPAGQQVVDPALARMFRSLSEMTSSEGLKSLHDQFRFLTEPRVQQQLQKLRELNERLRLNWPPEQPVASTETVPSTEPDTAAQDGAKPRKRGPGGGRKPFFTKEEIEWLQSKYWQIRIEKPTITDLAALRRLRTLVPEEKQGEGFLHDYRRWVFEPVRDGMAGRQNKKLCDKIRAQLILSRQNKSLPTK